ncbi:MAG: hypothetical protein ACPGGA_04215 [Balneolaceae bacterium]
MKTLISLIGFIIITNSLNEPNYELRYFKAFNEVEFDYALVLPPDFDRSKDYQIIAVLSEVHINDDSWKTTVDYLDTVELDNSIVIVPKVPRGNDHWGTHPIHHGFNDLLKSVRNSHGKSGQKFHLIGLEKGHETAFWWTYQSKELIASTSIVNGNLWKEDRWDKRWYDNLMGSDIPIYAYEDSAINKFDMSQIEFETFKPLSEVIDDIEVRN